MKYLIAAVLVSMFLLLAGATAMADMTDPTPIVATSITI